MSAIFTIADVPLVLPYESTLAALQLGAISRRGDSASPSGSHWPTGVVQLYLDGVSARPVEVRRWSNGQFQVWLSTGCNADDYALGLQLLAVVSREAGAKITPKGEAALDASAFERRYDHAWAVEHSLAALRTLIAGAESGTRGVVAGVHRDTVVGPRLLGSLGRGHKSPSEDLAERLVRFNYIDREDVYQAAAIVLSNCQQPRRVVRVSAYGGVPTLLSTRADFICMSTGERFVHLTLEQLAALLGESACWLSEDQLLAPSVSGGPLLRADGSVERPAEPDGAWVRLVDAAAAHTPDDLFADAALDPADGPKDQMLPAEWELLAQAPFMVFVYVASRRGPIDDATKALLQNWLLAAGSHDCALMRLAAVEGALAFEQHLSRELACDDRDRTRRLARTADIAESRLGAAQAEDFKRALLSLAAGLAQRTPGLLARLFGRNDALTDARNAVATLLRVRLR